MVRCVVRTLLRYGGGEVGLFLYIYEKAWGEGGRWMRWMSDGGDEKIGLIINDLPGR